MRRRVLRSSRRVGRTFSTAMLVRSLLRARDGRMGTIPLDVLGPDPLQLRIGEVGEDVPGDREALVDRAVLVGPLVDELLLEPVGGPEVEAVDGAQRLFAHDRGE